MRNISLLLIAALVAVRLACTAQAEDTMFKNYVVFPLKTKLQKILAAPPNANPNAYAGYAMIDMADILDANKDVDPKRIDEAFKTELAAAAKQSGIDEPLLAIWLRFPDPSMASIDRKPIKDAITEICHDAGFASTRVVSQFRRGSWREHAQTFVGAKDDVEDADETCIDDGAMRIYPVRTKCSRFILGDPKYDCYVELRQPIDGRFTGITNSQKERIHDAVAKLNLPQTRRIGFKGYTTKSAQGRAENYFTQAGGRPSPMELLAKELGFTGSNYSNSGQSASPEDLIDKPAPDFTLKALDGSEINLHAKIRGKAAVITFWGVACPACCDEAPYLTALQKQFGEKDLYVIAVNGYDESQETVEKFARENKLTYAIGMQGSKVAKAYTVASYPVTYLVDRDGIVTDYHLDFESGDEQQLVDVIVKLLPQEKK
jgi:peroxiredoxin